MNNLLSKTVKYAATATAIAKKEAIQSIAWGSVVTHTHSVTTQFIASFFSLFFRCCCTYIIIVIILGLSFFYVRKHFISHHMQIFSIKRGEQTFKRQKKFLVFISNISHSLKINAHRDETAKSEQNIVKYFILFS